MTAGRRHGPVVGIRVGRTAHVEVNGAIRGDRDVLLAVDVVASWVEVGQVPGNHGPGPRNCAALPRVTIDLVGLADVEDPTAIQPGERQSLRLGQPRQHDPFRRGSLGVGSGNEPDDLALVGLAYQQIALGAPRLHTSIGHPSPDPGLPARGDGQGPVRRERRRTRSCRDGQTDGRGGCDPSDGAGSRAGRRAQSCEGSGDGARTTARWVLQTGASCGDKGHRGSEGSDLDSVPRCNVGRLLGATESAVPGTLSVPRDCHPPSPSPAHLPGGATPSNHRITCSVRLPAQPACG